ncbi:MAG: hypothetical protein NTY38_26055 [Acidobacteria bacterium]|nr:hypothetical protein [Acidobacteriota bacterium]
MKQLVMLRRPPLGVAFLLLAAAPLFAGGLEAGAAKRVITPDLKKYAPVYLAGFGHNRVATGVHDDLFVRCLALRAGGSPTVLCGVDSIGLFADDTNRIRKAAIAQLGQAADIVVASLHDHEAPDTMGLWGPSYDKSGINEDYNRFLAEQTVEAIVESVKKLAPAEIAFASVRKPELDAFIHDNRPPDVHDAEVIALRLRANKGGAPIATLVNWANHPETLADENTLITADNNAALYTTLERELGGTAVFLNGAVGGMQSSLGAKLKEADGSAVPDRSFRKAEIIGQTVAKLAVDGPRKARWRKVDRITYREALAKVPIANRNFQMAAAAGLFKGRKQAMAGGFNEVPVGFLRLSAAGKPILEAACIPGELYPELSVGGVERYAGADFPDVEIEPAIKPKMTAEFRMLFGLANDEIGYIIPKAEWDNVAPWLQSAPKRWYGEVNSTGPETAPVILKTLSRLME